MSHTIEQRSRLWERKSTTSIDTKDLALAISASPSLRRASNKLTGVQKNKKEEQEDRMTG